MAEIDGALPGSVVVCATYRCGKARLRLQGENPPVLSCTAPTSNGPKRGRQDGDALS